ncbi:MAG TPA: lactonase family protein [Pirellulales bacterium]
MQYPIVLFNRICWLVFIALFGCSAVAAEPDRASIRDEKLGDATLAYVGTYTGAQSRGIYLYRLQTQNLDVSQNVTLAPLGLAVETSSPSFLEIDSGRRLLFAVNEIGDFQGKKSGAVSAFSIDPTTGKLKLINQRATMGPGPCDLVLDRTGKNLLVANYDGGSVAVLPVAADGTLGEASDFVQHEGKSINADRQQGPHVHCVTLDAANRFAFVCDLGCDKVFIYHFDAEHGKLSPNDPAFAPLKAGAGPRHMVFRSDGKFAYVINELDSTITAFRYDAQHGGLMEVQTISTLPYYYQGTNTAAEIEIHPSGKWLYASNRGHNCVVLYSINSDNGKLNYIEEIRSEGKTPRHFEIDPSGKYLTIANQDSGTLLVCRIESDSGRLKPSGVAAEGPTPVCVKFLPPTKAAQ